MASTYPVPSSSPPAARSPASHAGLDGYDIRGRFAIRFRVPAWLDNDVNIMAHGELRAGAARSQQDVVFVKAGSGIGAGLASYGQIHRGAQGSAGDFGQCQRSTTPPIVCRFGKRGCPGALAGCAAIVRDATEAARSGRIPMLPELLAITPTCMPSTS